MNLIKSLAAAAALATAAFASQAAVLAQVSSTTITGNGNNLFVGNLASPQTGSLYISFDITFGPGTINANDFVALWLDNGSATGDHTSRPNIGIKPDEGAGGADYFVRTTGTGGSFDAPPPQAAIDQTVTLFGHLYKAGGSDFYNAFDLWIDPDLSDLDAILTTTPSAHATGVASGLATISNFGFRAANLDGGDVVTIENLVISNGVPEPSSFALVALAAVGALAAKRRRA